MTAISNPSFRAAQYGYFPQERDIAPVQVPEVFQTESQHRYPAHAESPGKDGIVDAERGGHLLAEYSCPPISIHPIPSIYTSASRLGFGIGVV